MSDSRHVVSVELASHAYDISIEPGLLDRVGEALRPLFSAGRVGLVTDANVAPRYLERVTASLAGAGFDVVPAILPAGEAHKTLPTLMPVYDAFLRARFERSTPVIALGGGVVGDMTGFVAATLLRGVPFVQVPTTLLAMVDASVGGKTGIDHATGKNLIGAFHQPSAVLIDPSTLNTLPGREFRSGLAECIKHEIIRDADGFASLETDLDAIARLEPARLSGLIAHNVQIKARVVMADPFEQGERAHLNLGHTFGHAIESVSNFAYAHGEAIALGIVAATYVAREVGLVDDATARRITRLLQSAGLPTGGLTLPTDDVVAAMYFDKKVRAGRLRIVLPDGLGAATIRDDLPRELIERAVASLR